MQWILSTAALDNNKVRGNKKNKKNSLLNLNEDPNTKDEDVLMVGRVTWE